MRDKICSFPNCFRRGQAGFFDFPTENPKRAQWLTACGLDDIGKNAHICVKHFKPDDLSPSAQKRMRLRPEAIPHFNYTNEEIFMCNDFNDHLGREETVSAANKDRQFGVGELLSDDEICINYSHLYNYFKKLVCLIELSRQANCSTAL